MVRSCIFRGMGFARSICNTKAKLAINRRIRICMCAKVLLHRDLSKWKRHLIDRYTKTDYTYANLSELIAK